MGLFFSPPFLKRTAAPKWNMPSSPDAKSTSRGALAAPEASSSPARDGGRCFQGCSSIPALLPEPWLLLVSGLTLTSSGVGNSGILSPNSRLFPPMGRNPHDWYQIPASKPGRFFPGHSFYCFPPTQLHPNMNARFPLLYSTGRSGFRSKYLCWDGHGIPGALCCHSELQNGDKTFHLLKVESSDFPQSTKKRFHGVCMWEVSMTPLWNKIYKFSMLTGKLWVPKHN